MLYNIFLTLLIFSLCCSFRFSSYVILVKKSFYVSSSGSLSFCAFMLFVGDCLCGQLHSANSGPPPALAGHSMTLVNDVVIIVGGMLSSSRYSEVVYSLEVTTDGMLWTELTNRTGAQPVGQSLSHILLLSHFVVDAHVSVSVGTDHVLPACSH